MKTSQKENHAIAWLINDYIKIMYINVEAAILSTVFRFQRYVPQHKALARIVGITELVLTSLKL